MNSSIGLIEDFAEAMDSNFEVVSIRYLHLLDAGALRRLGSADRPHGPCFIEIAWLLLAHVCSEDLRDCVAAAKKFAYLRDENGKDFIHALCELLLHKTKSRRGEIQINFTQTTAQIRLLKNDCIDWTDFTSEASTTQPISRAVTLQVRKFADMALRYP